MYADQPPKLWTPPHEIVRPTIEVPWDVQAHRELERLGIPFGKRLDVIKAIKDVAFQHRHEEGKEVARWLNLPEVGQASILQMFIGILDGKEPKGCTFEGVASDNPSALGGASTTFSWTVSVSNPGPDRYIILAISGQRTSGTPRSVNTLTIGGNGFTQVVYRNNNQPCGIYIRQDSTFSSGTLSLIWNNNMNSVAVGVYRAILPSATAYATLSANLSNPNLRGNINIQADGIVIGCAAMWTSSSSNWTNTWTGATERYDLFPVGNAGGAPSGGMSSGLGAETNRLVGATLSTNTSEGGMVAASW